MLLTDNALVKQCQNGNNTFFKSLYNRYIDKIYNYIYYKTLHKETAEDITSQTFLKALENIKSFEFKKGTVQAWLYKIASNLVIDYFRKNRECSNIDDIWDCSARENIEIDFLNKETFEQAYHFLQQLSDIKRDIVIMRIWQNLSYKEISEIKGITEANCKMTFYRTINKIRHELIIALIILLLARNSGILN